MDRYCLAPDDRYPVIRHQRLFRVAVSLIGEPSHGRAEVRRITAAYVPTAGFAVSTLLIFVKSERAHAQLIQPEEIAMHFCLTGQYTPHALKNIMDNPTTNRYEAAKNWRSRRWQIDLDV
jgi:hypothetical protein